MTLWEMTLWELISLGTDLWELTLGTDLSGNRLWELISLGTDSGNRSLWELTLGTDLSGN